MKARFLALAALLFGVAACQTEPEGLDVNMDGTTTISVVLPEDAITRAGGTDSAQGGLHNTENEIVRVILQVYYGDKTSEERLVKYLKNGETTTNFDVRLVPNRNYTFVAWADQVDAEADVDKYFDTKNLKAVTMVSGTWNAMEESRDAYTATKLVEDFTSSKSIELILKRPFAKLRVVTTDLEALNNLDIEPTKATVTFATKHYTTFNAYAGVAVDKTNEGVAHRNFTIDVYNENWENNADLTLYADYFFAADEQEVVNFTLDVFDQNDVLIKSNNFNTPIPVKRNNLTTIQGNVLTDGNKIEVTVDEKFGGKTDYDANEETITETVDTAEEFKAAFESGANTIVLDGDINLDDLLLTRAAYTAYTVQNGKTLAIDLNGYKLSATTSENSGNQELFLVKGNLTFKNGTIEYEHLGENMGWGAMTTIFDVTAGGVLNLEGVTATNKGGSDMGFVAHLNNWGEVTLNVENCTLESNYVPVRVFNSGNDMNNVTIKNSTLKGGSAAFWVHNYTVADFGSEAKAEAQKALLNLNIYDQGNTFSPDINGIRYGFTNSVRTDAYGITKVVSEDGTEVTLGSIVENGLIRRGVAGAEENSTIKKVVIEEGVGVLYDRTFRRFYALEEVVLPSTLTTIGAAGSGVFQSCNNLKSIVIPESVTVLGKGSFQECSSLESINIPSGVTRIEENALRATGLVSVEFHEGVTYFGAQAFRDCKQLKEVIINAPEFTVEANAFGVTSGTLPGTTIYVANAEMKAYLESTLAYKNQFTIVAPNSVASKEDLPVENGKLDTNFEEDVNLYGDITVSATETNANSGYGATGVTVTDGAVLNGQGHKLTVNNAWDTWDCVVAAKGGTIKNLTVSSAMRGIFMPSANGDVFIDNVIFDNVIYTFNSDGGNKNYGVYISNSTLNGWTSHSDVHKEVIYTNCKFGKGNGYAYCRPYGPTEFVGCAFEAGFEVDAIGVITFENCTIGGVALTADNLNTLVTSGIANASVK